MSKNYHSTDDQLGLWIKSLDAEKNKSDAIDALISILDSP